MFPAKYIKGNLLKFLAGLFACQFSFALYSHVSLGAGADPQAPFGGIGLSTRASAVAGEGLCALDQALCGSASASESSVRFADVGAEQAPPEGYFDFCIANASLCDNATRQPTSIKLDEKTYKSLVTINAEANDQIVQVSDAQHYGRVEYWSLPKDGKGDCEDIAIFKRLQMIKAGFPLQALLLTYVQSPKVGKHIVLTVKTDKGDLVADNLSDDLKFWSQTPYKYMSRQSQYQQNVWQKIVGSKTRVALN